MSRVFCLLLLLCGCVAHRTVTRESFDSVYLGMPASELSLQVGDPYAVQNKGAGTKEYEYIEKTCFGTQCMAETHYFLIISQGKVVGKRITTERVPAYNLIYQDDPNNYSY